MQKLVTLLLYLMPVVCFAIDGDPERGSNLTQTCIACHSTDGNSTVGMWPKIAGQHKQYIYNQLKAFQMGEDGPRYDPSMYPMVVNLSDQDLKDLSAFYSSQKTTIGAARADLLSIGQSLYRGGDLQRGIPACSGCHQAKGLGNKLADFPRLSGQNAEYTATQLKKYRTGERRSDPNEIMRIIAAKMTDEQIEAVSSYVAGLH